MDNSIPIFKQWAPEWLIRLTLFLVLLPNIALFFLPMTNIPAAAGFYGSEPADIQFSVALFYAGYVGFYSLERRFFTFLVTREYFIVVVFLQLATSLACYLSNDIPIFFPIRFMQGILFASTVNVSLSLLFTRFSSERAREISFSVFFGLLLCALPFNNFVTADLIDAFNFNVVYKASMFSYLPCLILLMLITNNVRLNTRFPLNKLDWQSFSLYSILLVLIAYIMIYGQEYYWLDDLRIRYSVVSIAGLLLLFFVRQRSMKRPYIDLRVLNFRNCKAGLLILFIMYICRFASGITNHFFAQVLRFDPMHISYMNLSNLFGIVVGVMIACYLVLQKKTIRTIWRSGFLSLLAFHIYMYFLFDVQANEFNYFAPLFVQGLGVGLIMVPTIVYIISAVPVSLGPSAAAMGLTIRYLGFCISIGLMNYFELFGNSSHYNAFQDHLTETNPVTRQFLQKQVMALTNKGLSHGEAVKGAYKLLVGNINKQGQLRYAMDYYELMSWLIVVTLLWISLFPYLNRTVAYLRSRRLSPA